MIKDYEIKKLNNEEILYLYLDLNTEFAKLTPRKKENIKNEINNYIKKKNIKFKGKKIVLMASGLILGTLLSTKSVINNNNEYKSINNYQYGTTLKLNNDEISNTFNNIIEEKNIDIIINETKKNNEQKRINKTEDVKEDNIKENNNETITTKKMVSLKRSNGVILYMETEEYLIGVVASEMPASFESEALKAQAIAARTYALKQIEDNVILTDSTSTQVYKDNNELKKLWGNSYTKYYNKIKNAVYDTEGLTMTYNNSIINAFYHSTSNGYTENASAVFGNYPYLISVESLVDQNVSNYEKKVSYSYENISKILNIPVTPTSDIYIKKNNTGRCDTIIIDNNTYSGIKFRTLLKLRSTDFSIDLNENEIIITTHGYGHGVGMSQYGANEYAKLGWNYESILKHYYTGIDIVKYY